MTTVQIAQSTVQKIRELYGNDTFIQNQFSQGVAQPGRRQMGRAGGQGGPRVTRNCPDDGSVVLTANNIIDVKPFQDSHRQQDLMLHMNIKPRYRGATNQGRKRDLSHDTVMRANEPLDLGQYSQHDRSPNAFNNQAEEKQHYEGARSDWDAASVIFEAQGATTRAREKNYANQSVSLVKDFESYQRNNCMGIEFTNNGRSSASSTAVASFSQNANTQQYKNHLQTPMMQKSNQVLSGMPYTNTGPTNFTSATGKSSNNFGFQFDAQMASHQQQSYNTDKQYYSGPPDVEPGPQGKGFLHAYQKQRIIAAFGNRGPTGSNQVNGLAYQAATRPAQGTPMHATEAPRTRGQSRQMAAGDNIPLIGGKRGKPCDLDQSCTGRSQSISQAGKNTAVATTQAAALTQYDSFDRNSSPRDIDCDSFIHVEQSRAARGDELTLSGSATKNGQQRGTMSKLDRKRHAKLIKNNQKHASTVLQQIRNVQIESNLAPGRSDDDAVSEASVITLTNKRTRQEEDFKLYEEDQLPFLREKLQNNDSQSLADFNMEKLELEYDYDTDEEQLCAAKAMLLRENLDAVKFYVKEGDPLILVDNLVQQKKSAPRHKKH